MGMRRRHEDKRSALAGPVRWSSAAASGLLGAAGLLYGLAGGAGPVPVATGALFGGVALVIVLAGRSEPLDRVLGFGILVLLLAMLGVAALVGLP